MENEKTEKALYAIPFTQYVLPDGRRKNVSFQTSDLAIFQKAEKILAAGLVFECEVLRSGLCSFTITDHRSDEGDIAFGICSNGPKVVKTIEALISGFDLNDYVTNRGILRQLNLGHRSQ